MKKNTLLTLALVLGLPLFVMSQNTDSTLIASIYKNALNSRESYNNLRVLCESAGPRQIGSEASIQAVHLLKQQLEAKGFDKVYLQEFKSAVWVSNSRAKAKVTSEKGDTYALEVDVFGPSVATEKNGLEAGIVEVSSIAQLETLGKEKTEGKIVFYNTPMNNSYPNPLDAYVEARMLRFNGTSRAAEYGAVGVFMRSLTTSVDEFPHTGSIVYDENFKKIPALALSSKDSDILSSLLKKDPDLKTWMYVDTETIDAVKSYNVIAEIEGKTNPEEVIIVGAHIDSWYNTPGAHDDGAGCIQMMDIHVLPPINCEQKNNYISPFCFS